MAPVKNAYVHGMLVPAGAEVLYISGQVGADAAGNVSSDPVQQAETAWSNLMAIAREAGMNATNIVKLTTFIVDEAAFAP